MHTSGWAQAGTDGLLPALLALCCSRRCQTLQVPGAIWLHTRVGPETPSRCPASSRREHAPGFPLPPRHSVSRQAEAVTTLGRSAGGPLISHMRISSPALPVTPKQDAKPGNTLACQRLQRAGPAHCGSVSYGALGKSTSYWPCPHICGQKNDQPHRLCAKGSPYISASCPPPPPHNTPGTGIGDRRLPGTGKGRPSHHPPTWSTACPSLVSGAAPV